MSYTAFVDDETHDERRQRWQEEKLSRQQQSDISIKIDNDLYISIIKTLYPKYNINDIHFLDGNKYNLKKQNILIKLTAI